MAALCAACGSVFEIVIPRAKAKRRKVERPPALRLLSDEPLHLAFRTNFRLDKNENFQASASMGGVFSLVALLMTGLYLEGDLPVFLPLIFAALACVALYSLATIVYNTTQIRLDSEAIHIARGPLPSFTRPRQISLEGVDSFSADETAASQREGYDTPRYHIRAHYADGARRLVIGDLTEDYAEYIAGQLNRRLRDEDEQIAQRLSDDWDDGRAESAEESRPDDKQIFA